MLCYGSFQQLMRVATYTVVIFIHVMTKEGGLPRGLGRAEIVNLLGEYTFFLYKKLFYTKVSLILIN